MHGDLLGVILSVLLILICFVISFFIVKFGKNRFGNLRSEIARKIVHIGVSNWFFIYYFVFESSLWPILGLCAFALINTVLNISGTFHTLIGQESTKRNWGLVQYPVSIIILLVLTTLGVGKISSLGCAILGMGYGDGLAALAGRKFGKRKLNFKSDKTVAGFAAMTFVTFVVVLLVKLAFGLIAPFYLVLLLSIACALIAALVEAYTPYGLDNITVPLVIFLISDLV